LKARRAAKKCCPPAPCCEPAPAPCCVAAPVDPCCTPRRTAKLFSRTLVVCR
jgi:hypothetical protein